MTGHDPGRPTLRRRRGLFNLPDAQGEGRHSDGDSAAEESDGLQGSPHRYGNGSPRRPLKNPGPFL